MFGIKQKNIKQESIQLDVDSVWYADLQKSKQELAKVSPTFCLAKWLQVTLHLHQAKTHSCHHPLPHSILPSDIAQNPSGLHNTQQKLLERKAMLNGEQPKPCEYCWNIENSKVDAMSDRVMKSSSEYLYPYANKVIQSGLGERINPTYVEVSFSHLCNFKCSYCSADYSSKWQQEIEKHGAYSTHNGQQTVSLIDEENNQYIEAFWKWWPDLKNSLRVFRITGGEPLLSKNTWKILEQLEQDPAPHLELAINTNLGVSTDLIEKLVFKCRGLLEKNKINKLKIYTSIDAYGEAAEYIRHGLNFQLFLKHVHLLLQSLPQLEMSIMSTYSALSVVSYTKLLQEVYKIRQQYINEFRQKPFGISTSYLRYPEHLSVKVLNPDKILAMQESLNYMQEKLFDEAHHPAGFTEYEINAMKNLISWFEMAIDQNIKNKLIENFKSFYREHDQRRQTDVSRWLEQQELF